MGHDYSGELYVDACMSATVCMCLFACVHVFVCMCACVCLHVRA